MSIASLLQQAKEKLFPMSDLTFGQYDAELSRIFTAVTDVLCHMVGGADGVDRKRLDALMRHITNHAPNDINWLGTNDDFIKACKHEMIFKILTPALALRVLILLRNGQEAQSNCLATLLARYGLYVGPVSELPELSDLRKAATTFVEYCQGILKQYKENDDRAKKAVGNVQAALSKIQRMGEKHLCDPSTYDALIACVLEDIETPASGETIFQVEHKCTVIMELITQWGKGIITEDGLVALIGKLPRRSDFRMGGWSVDAKGFLIENCTPNANAGPGSYCRTYTTHHLPDGTSKEAGSMSYQIM